MNEVYEMRYRRGAHFSKEDNWAVRNNGPYKADVMEEIVEHPKMKYQDWTREAALRTVQYIVDKWGACPAFVNPVVAQFCAQIHHLDLDFYRKYQTTMPGDEEPFLINDQIKGHWKTWHKGEPDPFAR
jgi:hypothetical protein